MSSVNLGSESEAWDFYPRLRVYKEFCAWMHLQIPSNADGTKLLEAVPLIAGLLGKRLSPIQVS